MTSEITAIPLEFRKTRDDEELSIKQVRDALKEVKGK